MTDENPEIMQHAEVIVKVALPVQKEDTEDERARRIKQRLQQVLNDGGALEYRRSGEPMMSYTETLEEAAERRVGEAEARHEAKLDRQRERHFDRHGHF